MPDRLSQRRFHRRCLRGQPEWSREFAQGIARVRGVRAILVHALHEEARRFHTRYQFESSPTDPLHLMLLIKDYQSVVFDGSHRLSRAFVAQGISLRG
jgi:hypothetical protein